MGMKNEDEMIESNTEKSFDSCADRSEVQRNR